MIATLAATFDILPEQRTAALTLVWIGVGLGVLLLVLPYGRRLARQIAALAVLGFREGLRLKVLWTVFALSLIPGVLAYFSDADGTHAGRARLILDTCLSTGEVLGAALIVLLAALSVAREIESRIMHTLGTKPVPRWAILAGKAVGFWAVDVAFLLGLVVFTGLLVRAVPLRAETRVSNQFAPSGSWQDLRRNALTTRVYVDGSDGSKSAAGFRFIKPGQTHTWRFVVRQEDLAGEQLALRFRISSEDTYASHIKDLKITVGMEHEAPLLQREFTAPQDRAFELFIDSKDVTPGVVTVTLGASAAGPYPPKLLVQHPAGVRLGIQADGFAANLFKALILMAIQGGILALISTGWSGVLSFPVTVAMGVILVLGGEMSRQTLELMQAESSRLQTLGLLPDNQSMQTAVLAPIQFILGLLPDFRAAGGPAAFIDGTFLSGWALAYVALWMGVVRGLGWALPGVLLFQRREVGR